MRNRWDLKALTGGESPLRRAAARKFARPLSMRLAFRGGTAAFELWLSSDAPLELGRYTPELDARGNTRISRCQLKLRLSDGKVMLESCGANPTGILRFGLAPWEWVDKGETRPLGLGDSVALSYLSGSHGDNRTPGIVLSCSAAVATTAPAPAEPAPVTVPVPVPTASATGPTANSRLLEDMLAEEPRRSSSHEMGGLGLPKKSLASIMDDDDDELAPVTAPGSSFSSALPRAAVSRVAAGSSVAAPARSDLPEERQQHECEVCYDTVPVAATLALCKEGHRFCAECAWRCCESSLGDGLVPACPKAKEARCGTVSRLVASAALTRWLTDPEADTQSRKTALASWDVSSAGGGRFESGKLDGVYESAERARQGAVQCIGKGCEAWYVPPRPHAPEPQRLLCVAAGCRATFCSACRQPFHWNSTCAEALRLSARWVRFLQDELSPFLMAAVRLDGERWAPVLQMHAGAKGALDEATKEALSRFDELRQMELWKQKHCRRCPYCTRVVEKIDGCDMLICGGNYHGGNQQRGCGKQFIWGDGQPNSSIPYEADLRGAADYATDGADGADGGGGDEDGPMRERRLRRDAREEHQQRAGVPVRCVISPDLSPRLTPLPHRPHLHTPASPQLHPSLLHPHLRAQLRPHLHPCPRPKQVRCDGCAEPIVGPRLQCVQCELSVDLCVGCAARDAGGAARLRLRDGRRHPRRHVFRRVRQKALGYAPSEALLAGGGGGTSAGASSLQQGDLLELTANHVDMRPGLGTAAAAAARAAEVRAVEARAAAVARAAVVGAAAAAAVPARSACARSGAAAHQRGHKRAAPAPQPQPTPRRGAHGGAASQPSGGGNSPIVLSSDED
jgi:hypothetical protein